MSVVRKVYLVLEPRLGTFVGEVAEEAIDLAKRHSMDVHFTFNDTEVIVHKDDTKESVCQDWDSLLRQNGRNK